MDIQTKTAAIGLVMCAAIIGVILLGGCAADHQYASSKQDWRTIHRPAPITPN